MNAGLKKAVDALLGVGGSFGTGEETADWLVHNMGWEEERASRFVNDLRELYVRL